jgi:uridine kinase
VLITITGGAAAGKTTLAAELAARLPVTVLHGDDWYVTEPGRGVWHRDEHDIPRLDVGDPRSVDQAALDAAVAAADTPDVLVEGMFAGRVGATGPRLDVYLDLAADLRLARKIDRQCVHGPVPLEVLLGNYLRYRRAAFRQHVLPARDRCDLVLDGERAVAELADAVLAARAQCLTARESSQGPR